MRPAIPALLLLASAPLVAQNTVPHWSTYFGGTGRDEVFAVRRGPGALVTVAGHTSSPNLATPGALQTAIAGGAGFDAFVARFDPSLPPAQQLLWCTYLGGTGLEFLFDAEVDPATGDVVVVGVTASPSFPGAGAVQGTTDGFVARIGAQGTTLVSATLVGGTADDWLVEVELDGGGGAVVAGVTESTDLPARTNAHHGGGTDAFVTRLSAGAAPAAVWSTYVGGGARDGNNRWARFQRTWPGIWEGNLQQMALTLDPSGRPVLATSSFRSSTPPSPALPPQAANAGGDDCYLCVLDPASGSVTYGTFFGGSGPEWPKEVVPHPAGGFVVGGVTISSDLPHTPGCYQTTLRTGPLGNGSDGFVCWIDPALGAAGLRYATYFGGNGGEDFVGALAVERSGIVTIAGLAAGGGNFPTTPRSLQTTLGGGQWGGFVARLELAGQGVRDLHYASILAGTCCGATLFNSVVLDDLGDAYLAGASDAPSGYPAQNAYQPTKARRAGVITHMPLLPGGTTRQDLALATPACGAPLYVSTSLAPEPGMVFGLLATNAPPSAPGVLVLGLQPMVVPFQNVTLLLAPAPALTLPTVSSALGAARLDLPVPAALPSQPTWGLHAQWVFVTNPACPGTGPFAASERLAF